MPTYDKFPRPKLVKTVEFDIPNMYVTGGSDRCLLDTLASEDIVRYDWVAKVPSQISIMVLLSLPSLRLSGLWLLVSDRLVLGWTRYAP